MRCYRCGKPATKFVNTAIGVAVTAASILESACDECWQKSHDATLTAALEEARGALVNVKIAIHGGNAENSTADLIRVLEAGPASKDYHQCRMVASERASWLESGKQQIDDALATINAALGRVKG